MGKTIYRWLHARMVLGVALLLHLCRRPWQSLQADGTRWLTAMQREGLGPTHQQSWPRFAAASRCIGCGWCDLAGDASLPRPSLWMQAAARLPQDAQHLGAIAASLRAKRSAILALCPTGADAAAVADVLDQQQAMLPDTKRAQLG